MAHAWLRPRARCVRGWALLLLCGCAHAVPAARHQAGDVVVSDEAGLLGVLDVGEIDGDLRITGLSEPRVQLPRLRRVRGVVHLEGSGVVALELPGLIEAGGLVLDGNLVLRELEVSRLRRLGGDLVVRGNGALTRLLLPGLEELGGALTIERDEELLGLDLARLRTAGKLTLGYLPRLLAMRLDGLVELGGPLRVERADALQALELAGLRRVGGELRLTRCARLGRVSLSALEEVGGDVSAVETDALASLTAPALRRVGGDVQLVQLPSLTAALLPALEQVDGSLLVGPVDATSSPLRQLSLDKLRAVGAELDVHGTALAELSLDSLAQVGGSLTVQENPGLRHLALGTLHGVKGALHVRRNALSKCTVDKLRAGTSVPAGMPGVEIDLPGCSGDVLDRAGLEREVARQRRGVDDCLDDAGATGGLPPGQRTVPLGFKVGVDGSVSDVALRATSADGPVGAAVTGCVEAAVRAWHFPALPEPLVVDAYDLRAEVQGTYVAGGRIGAARIGHVWGVYGQPHEHTVTAAAFTADAKLAVTGSLDRTLRLWDVGRGALLHIFRGHQGAVRAVVVRDKLAVSGGDDGTLRAWDLAARQPRRVIDTGGPVVSLRLDAAGRWIYVGDNRGRVRRFRFDGPDKPGVAPEVSTVLAFPGADELESNQTMEVTGLDLVGSTLVAGTEWGNLGVLALAGGPTEVAVRTDAQLRGWARLSTMALAPDGRTWLIGGGWGLDGYPLRVWDAADGSERKALARDDSARAVQISGDGRRALCATETGVELLDTATWEPLQRFELERPVSVIAISNDGGLALVGTEQGEVGFRDLSTLDERRAQSGHTAEVLALDAAAGRVASLAKDGTARVWDLSAGTLVRTVAAGPGALDLAADGQRLLVSDGESVAMWQTDAPEAQWRVRLAVGTVSAVRFALNDTQVVVGGDGAAVVLAADDGHQLSAAAAAEAGRVYDLSPSGRLAVGAQGQRVVVWSTEGGEVRRTFEVPALGFSALFVDDQRLLVGWDRSLVLWDLGSGEQVRRFAGHVRELLDVAVSADARHVATVSYDGSVRVWDLLSGAAETVVEMALERGEYPSAVALAQDGSVVVGQSRGVILDLDPVAAAPRPPAQ